MSEGGAGEDELISGALDQFHDGFHDGWHGATRRTARGIYGRAYRAGELAKKESTYFKKELDSSA